MKHILSRIITSIENAPLSLASFVTAFFALIVVRLLIENALGFFGERSFFFFFFEFTHTFLFFLCSFLLLLPVVRFAGSIDFRKAVNILLFGFLIILTPPIIDTVVFRGSQFWSFYEFDSFIGLIGRFFMLFGDTPDIGITYGVRAEVVIVTLALGLYAFIRSRRAGKALLVSLLTYAILFVLGTFPAWLTLVILAFQKSFLAINASDVAALFLTPEHLFARSLTDFRSVLNVKMSVVYGALSIFLAGSLLFREYPQYFIALWKNSRLPQLIYHGGLLLLGMAMAMIFTEAPLTPGFFHIVGTFVLLSAVGCAWFASVIANDCYDIRIDAHTNKTRPLIENSIPSELYKAFGILFFIASLILSGIISFSAMLLLLGYQAIAWLYSAPPLRLKRFPIIATALAAFAGVLVLVIGFLVIAPNNSLSMLPRQIIFFLFIAYALSLTIKDFKDMKGDALDHTYTLPVLLGATQAKLCIGSLLFLLYAASPLVINARSLFVPAILFGSLAFWALQKGTDDETSLFAYRKLPGLVLTVTALYGLTIAYMLF
ncbi:MAG: UbiA family prenyltransferase [Candidatus Moraniibacteriota bacterium]